MTRKDALTILNACFPVNIISYLHDAIDDSEHDFFVIQEQLLLAITLDYNRCIWESFIHDPEQFKKDYQEENFVNRTAKNAIAEFFKGKRIAIPANVIPSVIPNTEKLKFGVANYNKNADQPSTGMYPVVSPFDKFWNLSCNIAGITRDKRKSADYTLAKIDAFIYFNALYPFYGLDFNDWKPDIMKSKIEIFTRKQLAESFENPDGSTFEFVAMGGMKGEYFRCSLMDSILDRCSWAIDNGAGPDFKLYPNWNLNRDLPASLFFDPTSKIIKRILSTVLVEQSRAIQTIAGEKDFWGNYWYESNSDEAIVAQITKNIVESNHAYYEKFETLFNKKSDGTGTNKLPSIPAFEEAVKNGYLSAQDEKGNYIVIKSLSELLGKCPKLIQLNVNTLHKYLRKPDGEPYNIDSIKSSVYRKK